MFQEGLYKLIDLGNFGDYDARLANGLDPLIIGESGPSNSTYHMHHLGWPAPCEVRNAKARGEKHRADFSNLQDGYLAMRLWSALEGMDYPVIFTDVRHALPGSVRYIYSDEDPNTSRHAGIGGRKLFGLWLAHPSENPSDRFFRAQSLPAPNEPLKGVMIRLNGHLVYGNPTLLVNQNQRDPTTHLWMPLGGALLVGQDGRHFHVEFPESGLLTYHEVPRPHTS